MNNFFSVISDIFYILKGKNGKKNLNTEYKFAFLVHSRGYNDIYRKYHFTRYLPKKLVEFLMNHMWPITLSKVTGLRSIKTKEAIHGYVIGITMTAHYMMNHRDKALKKIREALYLARGKGAKIIGLGGLTSSLSGGGKELLDIDIDITTGHAYTAYNIFQNLEKLADFFKIPKDHLTVAVVGAAGSVGSQTSELILRAGYGKLILIDIPRKQKNIDDLINSFPKDRKTDVSASYDIQSVRQCDFVITATNTPEALITPELTSPGMVLIDDAQPSDIRHDVLTMPDVLTIEAGVVHTPDIHSNFNYGLKEKTDNFCCMAELLILASNEWKGHYVIHRATLKDVDEISKMGNVLGFRVAAYQNFLESIKHDKIEHVKSLMRQKHAIQS